MVSLGRSSDPPNRQFSDESSAESSSGRWKLSLRDGVEELFTGRGFIMFGGGGCRAVPRSQVSLSRIVRAR